MREDVNRYFRELMQNKLPDKPGTKAVVGWFHEDLEAVACHGDFAKMDPETASFQIASVTKLFTATLASIFHQEGKLNLGGQVGDCLDLDEGSTIRTMKIEDLLTHHAGLPSAPRALLGKHDEQNPYQQVSQARLMDYLNRYKKPVKSKSRFQYSNLGFGILGQILEGILGKPYETLVKERISAPLGMEGVLWITRPPKATNLVPGGMHRDRESVRWQLNAMAAAGGIDANVQGMLRFAQGNLPGHPFHEKCEPCHEPRRTLSKRMEIGLGWLMTRHEGIGEIHSHNGATGGFNSFLAIHPEGHFGVVVLTNCRLPWLSEIGLAHDPATAIGFGGMKLLAKRSSNDRF